MENQFLFSLNYPFITSPGRGYKKGNSPRRTPKTTASRLPCSSFKARREQAWVGLSGLPGAPETLGCIFSPAEANEINTAQGCIHSSCSQTTVCRGCEGLLAVVPSLGTLSAGP